jgi:AAHS family benzoate transporter-like MFS transporter
MNRPISTTVPTDRQTGRARAALLALATMITVSDGFDVTLSGITLPLVIKEGTWGVTAATAGTIASALLLGMFLGALLAGSLADRIGRRPVILTTVALYGVFTLAGIFAPSLGFFLVCRVLVGMGVGGVIPAVIAHVSEFSAPHRRYRSNTILLTGTAVGSLVVPLVGLAVLHAIGFRGMWAIGGAFGILLIPFIIAMVPESAAYLRSHGRADKAAEVSAKYGLDLDEPGQQGQKARIRDLFTAEHGRRTILVLFGGAFVLGFATSFGTLFPQLLVFGGVEFSNALLFTAAYGLGAIIGPLLGGRLQDKGNPRYVVAGYLTAGAVAVLLVGFLVGAPLGVILVLVFLIGAFSGPFMFNGMVANVFPVHLRGTVLSLEFSVGRAVAVGLGALGGWLMVSGASVPVNFAFWALFPFLGAIVVFMLPAYRRRVSRPKAASSSESPTSATTGLETPT